MRPRVALAFLFAALAAAPAAAASHNWTYPYTGSGEYAYETGLFVEGLGGATFYPYATNTTRFQVIVNDAHAGNLVGVSICQYDASGACVAGGLFCENGAIAIKNDDDPVRVLVLNRALVHGCPVSAAQPTGGEITGLFD